MMIFIWFFTKSHNKTITFPTNGFGMVLINFFNGSRAFQSSREQIWKVKKALGNYAPNLVPTIVHVTRLQVDPPLGAFPRNLPIMEAVYFTLAVYLSVYCTLSMR